MRWIFVCLFAFCLSGCHSKSSSSPYEIGMDPSWYPLQLQGQEKNVEAFTIELLTTISLQENLSVAIKTMNWNNLLWGLKRDQYNAILSSMRPYAFYEDRFDFSELFLKSGPVIITPEISTIHTKTDLMGKQVAVIKGSSAALLLQTVPGILLKGYDSIPFALQAIANEDVHVGVLDVLLVQNYIKDIYEGVLRIASDPLSDEGLRIIALQNGASHLIPRFNKGLAKLKKSGEYERLLQKWDLAPDGLNKR